MGEEATKEEAKAVAKPEEKVEKKEEKQEEKKEEKSEEKKEEKSEEKKEEAKPSPPPPVVLFVDMHCVGCAKKIERSILKFKGVEGVQMDMGQNQVTVKGLVDPQALCTRIQKKTLRKARVLSPLPPAEGEATKSEVIPSQVTITTIELHVNMHCDACAQQLRRKILKMRGVQTAEPNLSTGRVIVSGTMDGDKLVEYIYRTTGKLARIIPPPPKEEEKKDEGEKKAEEKPPEEEKKEQNAEEEKKEEKAEKKEEDNADGDKDGGGKEGKGGGEEQKKEGEGPAPPSVHIVTEEDMVKRMMYWNGWNGWNGGGFMNEEEMARRRMVNWMPAVYVIDRPPPAPQLFSDENPNACCIT